jgi:archaellum component FlaF (FlaF/FlaG flagellin family)
LPKFTTAHYAAIVSTLAFIASGIVGVYFAEQTYRLNAAKEERELREKAPAIDLQISPNQFASSADVVVSIINRGDINIAPQDITVLHSFEFGEFYLSGAKQSVDALKSWLSLLPMGTIAPKAAGTMKAKVSGVTDGKDDAFQSGVELQFAVRIRFGDDQDTVRTFNLVRRIRR